MKLENMPSYEPQRDGYQKKKRGDFCGHYRDVGEFLLGFGRSWPEAFVAEPGNFRTKLHVAEKCLFRKRVEGQNQERVKSEQRWGRKIVKRKWKKRQKNGGSKPCTGSSWRLMQKVLQPPCARKQLQPLSITVCLPLLLPCADLLPLSKYTVTVADMIP